MSAILLLCFTSVTKLLLAIVLMFSYNIFHFLFMFVCSFQVETILDKENFTLEGLLDEDEIVQECKALNGRLINL